MNINFKRVLVFLVVFSSLIIISGCDILREQIAAREIVIEPTSTPISLPTQLSVQTRVDSLACEVAELVAIQTDEIQGDLLAWSPTGEQLAFVQPSNQYSGWYIGSLVVYDASLKEMVFTSKDAAVFGDLTWSSNGDELAFVSLDQQTAIYTVKTVSLADGLEMDIFGEEARTDEFASVKGIQSWASPSALMVTSICGVDCVRQYQFNAVSQTLIPQQEMRYHQNDSLVLENELVSPDGNWQVSLDANDNVWLSSVQQNRISLVLPLTEVFEVKWSHESTYLALRTIDQIKVFELGCVSN